MGSQHVVGDVDAGGASRQTRDPPLLLHDRLLCLCRFDVLDTLASLVGDHPEPRRKRIGWRIKRIDLPERIDPPEHD